MPTLVEPERAATAAANSRYCRECRQPIHAEATKCHACESFQDWRRFATLLAVVASLFAATGGAFGVWSSLKMTFAKDDSIIALQSAEFDKSGIPAYFQNDGKKAAIVMGGSITVVRDCAHAKPEQQCAEGKATYALVPIAMTDKSLLQPNSSKVVPLELVESDKATLAAADLPPFRDCKLVVQVRNFNSRNQLLQTGIDCDNFAAYVKGKLEHNLFELPLSTPPR